MTQRRTFPGRVDLDGGRLLCRALAHACGLRSSPRERTSSQKASAAVAAARIEKNKLGQATRSFTHTGKCTAVSMRHADPTMAQTMVTQLMTAPFGDPVQFSPGLALGRMTRVEEPTPRQFIGSNSPGLQVLSNRDSKEP